jgi:hypothetical protein
MASNKPEGSGTKKYMEIVRDQNAHTITPGTVHRSNIGLSWNVCNLVATSTIVGQKLVKLEEAKVDVWEYQSSLGALMYAMLGTHQKLAHCISILSQHSTMPGHEHLTALKHIFRYLRETSAIKLMYKGMPTALTLVGYTDADWANDINDHHSISRHVFILGGAAISWSAR